jgi:extracellular matrix regulatory protein A
MMHVHIIIGTLLNIHFPAIDFPESCKLIAEKQGEPMDPKLLNVGFGNTVVSDRVVAILTPTSSPMKRLREEARDSKRLIDTTQGRKTRSIIVTDSNHVILSAIQAETVALRFSSDGAGKEDESKNPK